MCQLLGKMEAFGYLSGHPGHSHCAQVQVSKSVAPQLQRVLDPEQGCGSLRYSACLES